MTSVEEEFKFKCFPGMLGGLSAKALASLQADCGSCFTCREVSDGDNYSVGSTFFVKADAVPRCGAERLALEIFKLHTEGRSFDPSNSGAEWWTQHIDHRDDIAFHWDRDYGAEENEGEHVHPILGTVTYLCDRAAPTVIFDKRGDFKYGDDISGALNKCIISQPSIGRHICFDGQLLHGAPSGLTYNSRGEDAEGTRITFLVNIWLDAVPKDSEPLSETIVRKLKFKTTDLPAFQLMNKLNVKAFDLNDTQCDNSWKWQLNSSYDDYIIEVHLPDINALPGSHSKDLVDCMILPKGSSSVYPGLLTISDDSEEESEDGSRSIDIADTEESSSEEGDSDVDAEGDNSEDSFVDDTSLVGADEGESTASEDDVQASKKRSGDADDRVDSTSKKKKV
jgi:hypothetical protein